MFYILKSIFKKRYFWFFLLLVLIILLQVTSEILLQLLLTQLSEQANYSVYESFKNKALLNSVWIGLFMILLAGLFLLWGFIAGSISAFLATRLSGDIRVKIYNKIQTLSFAEIDSFKTSSLITRITTDVDAIQEALFMGFRIGLRSFVLSIGGIIGSIILSLLPSIQILPLEIPNEVKNEVVKSSNWYFVPVLLIFISLIMFSILAFILTKASKQYRKSKYATDLSNNVMRENILGVRLVKSFNLQDEQIKRFAKTNENLRKTTEKSFLISTWMFPIINISMSWSIILTVFVGGATSVIDVSKVGSVISITTLVLFAMTMMINVILQLGIAMGSSPRIVEVLKYQPSIQYKEDGYNIEKPSIKFEKVSFKYNDTGEYVLKNINVEIKENETIGIIGATGSGKSTFVSLITRMYDVKEGRIIISGHNVKDINRYSLRHSIAVSPQRAVLFSGTIASNLKFGKSNAIKEEMIAATKGAQAYDFIMEKEGKFEHEVEQRGRNFSGGQQQRLSIARALISNPKILILDSSTSALDMITEKKVNEYIKTTNIGRTTFIISQRISGVKNANRILVFEKGKIVGDGSHIELLKNNKTYRDIAISQIGEEGIKDEISATRK